MSLLDLIYTKVIEICKNFNNDELTNCIVDAFTTVRCSKITAKGGRCKVKCNESGMCTIHEKIALLRQSRLSTINEELTTPPRESTIELSVLPAPPKNIPETKIPIEPVSEAVAPPQPTLRE